jgi:uncharacterized OsmC-like protein
MSKDNIRSLMEEKISCLNNNPQKTQCTDLAATAVLEGGLKCRANGPTGMKLISDMPKDIGGEGSAPSPGWYMRAAMATCNATSIAMKAALEGIELSTLEVTIDSESNDCGIFGIDESIKAGPLNMRTRVRIGAKGVMIEKLHEIVKWAGDHAWVANAVCRSVPIKTEVEIV